MAEQGSNGAGAAVIGTPDDLVAAIRHLQELTGGFGVVLGFAHDWANHEATMRSWELVARYVIPELDGSLRPLRASADYVHENQRRAHRRSVGRRDAEDHGQRDRGQGDGGHDAADGRASAAARAELTARALVQSSARWATALVVTLTFGTYSGASTSRAVAA